MKIHYSGTVDKNKRDRIEKAVKELNLEPQVQALVRYRLIDNLLYGTKLRSDKA